MRESPFDIPNPDGDPFGPAFRFPPVFEKPVFPKLRWRPARVRILVVTDGASYDEVSGFGLGIALKDAFDPAHPDHPTYARFEFTRAHRSTDDSADIEGFTFGPGSLDDFDQVWLFGVLTSNPYLSPQEVAVVEAFMDQGGGVLAMGDHEDLGLGLCGGIKRVRSMRKWWFAGPIPPGMLPAPHSTDLTRNDTVQAPAVGEDVNSGEQNDATPQPIYPVYRYAHTLFRPHRRIRYPHPILCGPRGAIRVMPDHQHEGDCILPDPSFAAEYTGGVEVELIAHGRNVVGRDKLGYVISDPRAFGLIGVWDGHKPAASQGRVVVDSTWHHWFNINLLGLRSENGTEYKDVLAYFRNVAVWLTRKERHAEMRRAGLLVSLFTPTMVEYTLTLKERRPELATVLGRQARDALGRIAPQCQAATWYFDWLVPVLPKEVLRRIEDPNLDAERNPVEIAAIEALASAAFGGIVNEVAIELHRGDFNELEHMDERLDELAAKGAGFGLRLARRQLTDGNQALERTLR